MALIPLVGGAYEAQSLIASAQRCVNLYPEKNPEDSPVPYTHYLTPGLVGPLVPGIGPTTPARCTFTASNGQLFIVKGTTVSYIDPNFNEIVLGILNENSGKIVVMQDNGLVIIIVDGTSNGWAIDLTSHEFGNITDPNFMGGTRVDYLDTFFVFNKPGTNQWYISLSEVNFQMLAGTQGSILSGNVSSGGTGYTSGVFGDQALTGGAGTGARATIVVTAGIVKSVSVAASPGSGYLIGDILTANLDGSGFLTGILTNPGSGYTTGTYNNVAFVGGTGTGATANITVAGGSVTGIQIVNTGVGYGLGDTLGAPIPGGTGFLVTVDTIGGQGFTYTIDSIGGGAFDPLDIATKAGYPDAISAIIVMHLEIWLIGEKTTEIWYNAGAADFTFQILPGVFIEHGCIAPYSIARQDLSIYWLSQDEQGQCIVLKGNSYAAHRISTFAIENTFSKYGTVNDAIGFCYQEKGHTFYVLTFPTADATWVWDESSELWHQRASLLLPLDTGYIEDGNLHAVVYNVGNNAYGKIVVGEASTGALYQLTAASQTDVNSTPITRIRSFPHLLNSLKRVSYSQFIADMAVGEDDGTMTGDGSSSANPPVVSLRWSDDRGRTYGNYVQQSLGAVGQYLTNIQFQRLGLGRDRVFELSWSVPAVTALNGAWVDSIPAQT